MQGAPTNPSGREQKKQRVETTEDSGEKMNEM